MNRVIVLLMSFAYMLVSCSANETSDDDIDYGMEHHDVVIVGAGISGLTCGYYLGKRDFLILEKNERVGGRAISGIHNNFSYAKGAEYLGRPESHLAKMIKGLHLTPKEIPSPMDAYFDGKTFYYGSEGLDRYMISGSSVSEYKRFISLLLKEYNQYDEIPDLVYNSW
ncbi:MAG: FAD-dependent oxidoreductase, partial [Bacteroidales bacterium]